MTVVGDSRPVRLPLPQGRHPNILDFENAFPDVTVVTVNQNYRSTQTILDAANSVIANNPERKPQHLWSELGKGDRVTRYTADGEHDEAAWVVDEIVRLHRQEHESWGDVAVFYRANAQSRPVEEALARRNVPYKVVGGTRFYERRGDQGPPRLPAGGRQRGTTRSA